MSEEPETKYEPEIAFGVSDFFDKKREKRKYLSFAEDTERKALLKEHLGMRTCYKCGRELIPPKWLRGMKSISIGGNIMIGCVCGVSTNFNKKPKDKEDEEKAEGTPVVPRNPRARRKAWRRERQRKREAKKNSP